MDKNFEEKDYSNVKFDFKVWVKICNILKKYSKIVLISIFINLLIATTDIITPFFNKVAIDNYNDPNFNFTSFILIYFLFIIVVFFLIFSLYYLSDLLIIKCGYSLRIELFKKIQKYKISFYDKTNTGYILSRLTSDIDKICNLSFNFIDIFWTIPKMFIALIFMFFFSIKMTIIALLLCPIITFITYLIQKRVLYLYRQNRKYNSILTKNYSETIGGLKTIKTLVLEKIFFKEFNVHAKNLLVSEMKTKKVDAFFRPIITILVDISIASVIWIGGKEAIQNQITFGGLVFFIELCDNFLSPFSTLSWIINEFQSGQANAERVMDLYEMNEEVVEKVSETNKKLQNIKGEIEFKDVCFNYVENEEVLENFNLKINAGETVALVGKTGSGKSTIVNLLCRFYDPKKGTILIDGMDYYQFTIDDLLSKISYVLQTPFLFDTTIYENIVYGNLNASYEDVVNVCKKLNCHDFIMNLENGYETVVKEGGAILSSGQKQLISFARALIKNPDIFILDEATSAIDTETEKIIQNTIENSMNSKTCIVVAHRLSTITHADKIVVIDKGKIIEMGNHQQLMKLKKTYYQLFTNEYLNSKIKDIM